MEDRWLTVKDIAQQLSTHKQFVYEALATMGLKHTRIGKGKGCIRVRQSWLDTWAEARAATA